MSNGYRLRGKVRHYAWGGTDFIPDLLGIDRTNQPWAELWLGAHPQDSAEVLVENQWQRLDQLIAKAPNQWLGQAAAESFGELPYLLKVLDVANPLSIQVHPNMAQAKFGYAQENADGIALTDPKRNFKDENHKPELALALSDFWLLYGLRTRDDIVQRLNAFHSLHELSSTLLNYGEMALLETVFLADEKRLNQWLGPVFDAVNPASDPNSPDYWISSWRDQHANMEDAADVGVLAFLLMNLVKLEPGESIYQEAGVPHAYLRGQCVEVMANSDNVLRAGLTAKHVDAELMLKHLDLSRCREQCTAPPNNLQEFKLRRYGKGTTDLEVCEATITLRFTPHEKLGKPHLQLKETQFFAEAAHVSVRVGEGEFLIGASPNHQTARKSDPN